MKSQSQQLKMGWSKNIENFSLNTFKTDVVIEMKDLESPFIDEIIIRFPILFQGILNELDNKSLAKCRRINKNCQNFIDNERFVLFRKLQKYHSNMEEFFEQWKKVTQNASKETIRELSVTVYNFFEGTPIYNSLGCSPTKQIREINKKKDQWSPLHITAEQGNLELSKYIIEQTGDENPQNRKGDTAFQMAAEKGQLEVTKLIINNLEDKNPRGYGGWTALHFAAMNGHLEVCKLINESIEDGATVETYGVTPVDYAVAAGHLEVFKLLAETLENKNHNVNGSNWTPLHAAAYMGHLEFCRYIIDSGADKNPIGQGLGYTGLPGYTPLSIAAAEGHPRICKLFIDEWADLVQVLKGFFYTNNIKVFTFVAILFATLFAMFIITPVEVSILLLVLPFK